jgi:hypothetical protein
MGGALFLREPEATPEVSKVHAPEFTLSEREVNGSVHVSCSDGPGTRSQNASMARSDPDWYLPEWIEAQRIEFPHAWLKKETGWSAGKVSNVLTGLKRYDKDIVNIVSRALQIRPYELLMPPPLAYAIRAMREEGPKLAAEALEAEGLHGEIERRLRGVK